jgi:hypothetical protein
MQMSKFHSKFGGLWIDDTDHSRVAKKLEAILDPSLARNVEAFVRDGFVIIEKAASAKAIDAYLREYEAAADAPDPMRVVVPFSEPQPFSRDESLVPGAKVLDTGMLLPSGQKLCFAAAISRFLEAVFEEKALAFQTLHFEVGSTQAVRGGKGRAAEAHCELDRA